VGISGALFLVIVLPHGLTAYRVESSSMEPTLHCAAGPGCLELRSDKVLVDKFIYEFCSVHRGDIIVFRASASPARESTLLIKRVVAVGGEEIQERRGRIFINSRPLIERYIRRAYRDQRNFGPLRVSPGTYFVLGDNRKRSRDSRNFGVVRRSHVIGKVVAIVAPLSRVRLLV
jgi:signal peptidase I